MTTHPEDTAYHVEGGDDDFHDEEACQECAGDGGWNSCMEDTCCAIGGEEGCDDPLCWRVCPYCRGDR